MPEKRDRRLEGADAAVSPARAGLRALIEHGHGTPILRPAGDVITHSDRPLLAVRDGAHALTRDAARHQIFAHGFGAAGAERDVVFARAALVGVAIDRKGVTVVIAQPLRLFVARRARLIGELGRVSFKENAIPDIDDKILLAARHRSTGERRLVGLLGATGDRKGRQNSGSEAEPAKIDAKHGRDVHSGALHKFRKSGAEVPDRSSHTGLAGPSLSEGSVNLDGRLQRTPDLADFPESFCNG